MKTLRQTSSRSARSRAVPRADLGPWRASFRGCPSASIGRLTAVLILALLALVASAAATTEAATEGPSEELIVFVSDAPPSERFERDDLPRLRATASDLGLPLRVVDIGARGAPSEIALTPLVVYQDARGRSIFQGRSAEIGKVAHFVRTQRVLPPLEPSTTGRSLPVASLGRARVAAPLKITELAGAPPAAGTGFDPATFEQDARRAILEGFESLRAADDVVLGPSDRSFTMDFYPYRGDDGGFYVTAALFSQFHCLEPVATWLDEPFAGRWEGRDAVFAEAAGALEREMLRQIEDSTIGDAFAPVAASTAAPSWDALGLALPEATRSAAVAARSDVALPARWVMADAPEGAPPRLIFRFPSPLERYSGEATDLRGALELEAVDDRLVWGDADGWIEAETESVTMGESALDRAIHGKMLEVVAHPTARFTLGSVQDSEPIAWGRTSRVTADGTFSMVGRELPITVQAEVEPVIGVAGTPQLRVRAGFQIRLGEPFGIDGPEGPSPARDTLRFHLDFLMDPATRADVTR